MSLLIPLPDIVKTRILNLGLPAFTTNILGQDLRSFIHERINLLSIEIASKSDDEPLFSKTLISRMKGSAEDDCILYKRIFMDLIDQNCEIELSSTILDFVGALVNMHSYAAQQIPEIFIAGFYSVHLEMAGKRRKLSSSISLHPNRIDMRDRFISSNNCIDSLRFRCSKIGIFPFIFEGSFMLAVLLTKKAKAFVLTCLEYLDASKVVLIKVCK